MTHHGGFMSYRIDNFIDGETTESRSERFGAIFDPATGQLQGTVALSTAAECLDAIASAERADLVVTMH